MDCNAEVVDGEIMASTFNFQTEFCKNWTYYPGSDLGLVFGLVFFFFFFCVQSQIAIWSLQRMRH